MSVETVAVWALAFVPLFVLFVWLFADALRDRLRCRRGVWACKRRDCPRCGRVWGDRGRQGFLL